MATYTCFISSPRISQPSVAEDSETWQMHVMADVAMVDANNVPVSPWGITESWAAWNTLTSGEPVEASDTLNTLRAKIADVVRPNYAPNIQVGDYVKVVWLDSGGVLSL